MKAYSTWQEALTAFIKQFGHAYTDPYNLAVEFESKLIRNTCGTYFLELEK